MDEFAHRTDLRAESADVFERDVERAVGYVRMEELVQKHPLYDQLARYDRSIEAFDLRSTVPRVAAAVSFLVGIHALVDFSLQIQAVALTFMAVLGAGVAQSESSRLELKD